MEKIKVGIIGAGTVSDIHLKSYSQCPLAEIYAICDINRDRVLDKAKQYKISKLYTDYKKMLEDENIDAVSICVWNNLHADITIAALNAGKHV